MTLLIALSMSLQTELAFAQSDPDYQIEVETNTTCSFINANTVNIRQAPNTQSSVIAQLNRGDGVRAVGRRGNWVQLAARDSGQPPQPYTPLQGWVFNQYVNGCSEDQFDRWRK
ncbi:MAG: SH3 domain-containing protein [Drouetiella hepatica Uher 2000/2452]|uniref:SH3 domain-containing protein n=1 Tax=Drouetiella hepatica Uher 2000/2452 TaxID=904376 RepID=A0A951UQA5_9CYAN|nr:SH3 domain-containing protein [Drouetiella hepatica Uher 2000/2452]